jgi:hypothetical protein
MGAADVTYEVPATDSLPEGTVVIQHQGARNAQAALDWIYHRVEAPTDVFVSGASAGAPASAFYAYAIARRYPQARVSQLGDAGGVFPVSAMAEMLRNWVVSSPKTRPARLT